MLENRWTRLDVVSINPSRKLEEIWYPNAGFVPYNLDPILIKIKDVDSSLSPLFFSVESNGVNRSA